MLLEINTYGNRYNLTYGGDTFGDQLKYFIIQTTAQDFFSK